MKTEQVSFSTFFHSLQETNLQSIDDLLLFWEQSASVSELQHKIGYHFKNKKLLLESLTHRSFVNEWICPSSSPLPHNERLEFIGDALLGSWVALTLFSRFPNANEGILSRLRVLWVNGDVFHRFSDFLGLQNLMLLGKGMETTQDKGVHLWADAFEALLGAIYLDMQQSRQTYLEATTGWESVVTKLFVQFEKSGILPDLEKLQATPGDVKTRLQELLIKQKLVPEYRLIKESSHRQGSCFEIALIINGEEWGRVKSPSKKEAHRQLATEALARLTTAGGHSCQ